MTESENYCSNKLISPLSYPTNMFLVFFSYNYIDLEIDN